MPTPAPQQRWTIADSLETYGIRSWGVGYFGINEKGNSGADVFGPEQIREFIRRDVNVLVNVLKAEDGDAIALLPGYERSTGARGELALAKWARLRILHAETFEDMQA